jgi:hypothetical protein
VSTAIIGHLKPDGFFIISAEKMVNAALRGIGNFKEMHGPLSHEIQGYMFGTIEKYSPYLCNILAIGMNKALTFVKSKKHWFTNQV